MNKKDFMARLKLRLNMNEDDTRKVLNEVLATFEEAFVELEQDEMLQFVGFGAFTKKRRQPRTGRNPQTGVELTIPAKKVIAFKMGKDVSEKVNPVEESAKKGKKTK
jgi:DNA-binding protein HU-beta